MEVVLLPIDFFSNHWWSLLTYIYIYVCFLFLIVLPAQNIDKLTRSRLLSTNVFPKKFIIKWDVLIIVLVYRMHLNHINTRNSISFSSLALSLLYCADNTQEKTFRTSISFFFFFFFFSIFYSLYINWIQIFWSSAN